MLKAWNILPEYRAILFTHEGLLGEPAGKEKPKTKCPYVQ